MSKIFAVDMNGGYVNSCWDKQWKRFAVGVVCVWFPDISSSYVGCYTCLSLYPI